MKTTFMSQDVWKVVESGFPEPANEAALNALSNA